jgi:hypothetical protein
VKGACSDDCATEAPWRIWAYINFNLPSRKRLLDAYGIYYTACFLILEYFSIVENIFFNKIENTQLQANEKLCRKDN